MVLQLELIVGSVMGGGNVLSVKSRGIIDKRVQCMLSEGSDQASVWVNKCS